MNREQITEALKMLKAWEVAVSEFERNKLNEQINNNPFVAAGCRVAVYSDTPIGTGSGSRRPSLTGEWSLADSLEYQRCLYMSRWLRAALSTLYEEEEKVITLKYMNGLVLKQICERIGMSIGKAKSLHKSGLDKMQVCLQFVEYIERSPVAA